MRGVGIGSSLWGERNPEKLGQSFGQVVQATFLEGLGGPTCWGEELDLLGWVGSEGCGGDFGFSLSKGANNECILFQPVLHMCIPMDIHIMFTIAL